MMGKCIGCGLCKPGCPVFGVIFRETVSPRGKWMVKKAGLADDVFFLCTNCKLCTESCPVNADLKVEDERAKAVLQGIMPAVNEKILLNIRKFGNPFGKQEEKTVGERKEEEGKEGK